MRNDHVVTAGDVGDGIQGLGPGHVVQRVEDNFFELFADGGVEAARVVGGQVFRVVPAEAFHVEDVASAEHSRSSIR